MASLNTIGGLHYEMMRRCYNEKSVAYKDYGEKVLKFAKNGMTEKYLGSGV